MCDSGIRMNKMNVSISTENKRKDWILPITIDMDFYTLHSIFGCAHSNRMTIHSQQCLIFKP